jgi:hypothetical protein
MLQRVTAGGTVMTRFSIALMVGLIALPAARPRAASSAVPIDEDFVITGCLTDAGKPTVIAPSTLVWTRSDIMLAAVESQPDVQMTDRVFYWLNDDEDLAKYRGRRVEIKGQLEDVEKGKVELDREKDFTKVKLSLDGHKEEAKVPTAWLNPDAGRHDEEFQIVARRVDVKKVKVLGNCFGSE